MEISVSLNKIRSNAFRTVTDACYNSSECGRRVPKYRLEICDVREEAMVVEEFLLAAAKERNPSGLLLFGIIVEYFTRES